MPAEPTDRSGELAGGEVAVGFPPLAHAGARILVLGSMPGKPSLRAGQYYANPRNAFWRIWGELLGFDPDAVYEERVAALQSGGVALWDVLRSCSRPGSLDARIVAGTEVVNDFASFLPSHPAIHRICFNGAKAAGLFHRHVLPGLPNDAGDLELLRLPSTSPAHATVPFHDKLAAWRGAMQPARRGAP
jgi:double-stranded uracil-DNA glycosylase